MGSTRALFASIGVSVSLVAAAALSLFTVSVVIAFGGWSAGLGESAPPAALVIAATTTTASKDEVKRHRAAPVVLPARAQRLERQAPVAPRRVESRPAPVAQARVVHRPTASAPVAAPAPVQAPPAATTPAPAPKQTAPTGDAVRRLGDDLSSTAQNTGKALNDVTAPLSPPVGAAVQKVLDTVAEVLQRTTNGLGGTLDKLGQKR
jgi:hypothetical protein